MTQVLIHSIDDQLPEIEKRIDTIINNPKGLANGRGRRTKLSPDDAQRFKAALIDAVGFAANHAAHGPLPNRTPGVGRPPDNAFFIFIDDIVRACEAAALTPGLRYVSGSESVPVQVFIELAPLLWGPVKAPRRVFQRWQRLRSDLARSPRG